MNEANNPKFQELVTKLREIFQIDQPELDFGIYRILNARADEINEYLEKRLPKKVQEALSNGGTAQREQIARELKEKEEQYTADGLEPGNVPKVQELRQKMAEYSAGVSEHENDVFTHLLTFFSRYYDNGDFISQRRYKGDTYAIPYSGEEVMLHWANKDQYYTKSGENFANYSFKLDDGRTVHFRLVSADTAKDNRKDNDKERRFALIHPKTVIRTDEQGEEYEEALTPVEEVVGEEGTELTIRFEYAPQPKGTKQDALVKQAVDGVLNDESVKARWLDLCNRAPTEKNPQRTLLEKYLTDYTSKNNADYFIHKDLGGFLRRELDFYIKNEVMHLDDVQNAGAFVDIEKNLRMIQCLRAIALELVGFLAQLEDFQKKLWLKKKFVVSSHYCITLDRVFAIGEDIEDEEEKAKAIATRDWLLSEIVANEKQWAQWQQLGLWDGAIPGTLEDLKTGLYQMVDTSLFGSNFSQQLISSIDSLDDITDGLLINSDNFQTLNLLQERYREQVKCVYIDPPYNTGGDGFAYKDAYQHATWLTMISERLQASYPLISTDGVLFSSIDAIERNRLEHALNKVFQPENRVEEIIWVQNTTKNQSPTYSTNHEYVQVYAKNINSVKSDFAMFRESKPGYMEIMELIEQLNPSFPSIEKVEDALKTLYRSHKANVKSAGDDAIDDWKGIYNYNRAEYRNASGKFVEESEAKKFNAKIWVWREDNPSMPQVKEDSQKAEFRDPEDPTYRFYRPQHPITKKPCSTPKTGWRWPYMAQGNQKNCFLKLAEDQRIAWGDDEKKIPQTKRFLHEVETNVSKSVINEYTDGEKEITNIFGKSRTFGGPKPTTLIGRFFQQAAIKENELVCDFFAGSGSTGEAVIRLNREDRVNRKLLLIEIGDHFYSVLIPRLQKIIYSSDWKNGKPTSPKTGSSYCFKVLKLENYEDTLNNLQLRRDAKQNQTLDVLGQSSMDDYLLHYMLDVESRGSLLSVEDFNKPFDYAMNIATDSAGAYERTKVDLVETFNYLIGLRVDHIDAQPERGFVTVTGTLPSGESCLVLWRDCDVMNYEGVSRLCDRLAINPADNEFDVVYINGDHNIPTVLTQTAEEGGATRVLKLRQIESEFLERMFSMEDV